MPGRIMLSPDDVMHGEFLMGDTSEWKIKPYFKPLVLIFDLLVIGQ